MQRVCSPRSLARAAGETVEDDHSKSPPADPRSDVFDEALGKLKPSNPFAAFNEILEILLSSCTNMSRAFPTEFGQSPASECSSPASESSTSTLPCPELAQPDIESMIKSDPLFSKESVQARRARLGLDEANAVSFCASAEFVSLGSFCGVGMAMHSIGIRGRAYPFDWVRSPAEGVINLVQNEFEDFLTFQDVREDGGHKVFANAAWGGSFWHHDPSAPKTRSDFDRRTARFLGVGDVPAETSRVFVRAVNSTHELNIVRHLHEVLQGALPDSKIYLLVIIDCQHAEGPISVDGFGDANVLFYMINQQFWTDFLLGAIDVRTNMGNICEAYGQALAFAINLWAGHGSMKSLVHRVQSMQMLQARVQAFEGGNPATESFKPQLSYSTLLRGQPVKTQKLQ